MPTKTRRSASPAAKKKAVTKKAGAAPALTPKQRQFAAEYLIDLNATQAAIRAGYSERTARAVGCELLQHPQIAELIRQTMARRGERTEIKADRVLKEVARIGFADIRKLFDANGNLRPIHELDDDTAAAVASIEVVEEFDGVGRKRVHVGYTKKIKFLDKNPALEKLMKHLGMFEKDNEQQRSPLEAMQELLKMVNGSRLPIAPQAKKQ